MTDPYASAKATAARLIRQRGLQVTWAKPAAPAAGGDPWNPQPNTDPEAPGPQTFTPSVVFFPPGVQTGKTLMAMFGVEVPMSFEIGLLAGNVPFTPAMSDVVTRKGVVLPIAGMDTLAPAGEAVLHTVYFKR